MSEYKVYLHICPNGKKYVGITSQNNVQRRWQSGRGYYNNVLFYRAIKKYGWENISHEVLFEGLSKSEAEEKEIKLITKYKSNDPRFGYNIENGGNCFGSHAEETKLKISRAQTGNKNHMFGKHSWNYGKKMSEEYCHKNRMAHLGQIPSNKGKPMSEEQKEKLRKPKTKEQRIKLSEAKSIPVICIETGEWFPSGKVAAEAKGISRGSIAYVVKNKRNTAGGYHWRYAEG